MVNLTSFNTLRVPAKANNLLELNNVSQLKNISEPFMFLGLGANVLFVHDFPGTIIQVNLKGRKVISQDDDEVIIEVAAGENWHELVMWTVENNWSGMENMALIPGTVGAAVVGNIAAYGQNQGDLVQSVEVYDLQKNTSEIFTHDQCKFVYRNSDLKKYLITKVIYKLSKTAQFSTSYHSRYESLEKELSKFAKPPYTIQDVAQAVINTRMIKMPDWTKIGTAGSFFKNPFVTREKYSMLSAQVKELQAYPTEKMLYPTEVDSDLVKIPAGRLLDELGWRNKTIGRVSTFEKHALVIINLGGATGQEIFDYTQAMREDIRKNFEIELEYEVRII
ncbi:MAG: UDP-N-acetylmuramate dehydrogenase [Candidatus Amesbacteria bacterium]|nr:UDP-N-acetylmuramate dehydrogenase [Candidatus Amesbacteria bacterium]